MEEASSTLKFGALEFSDFRLVAPTSFLQSFASSPRLFFRSASLSQFSSFTAVVFNFSVFNFSFHRRSRVSLHRALSQRVSRSETLFFGERRSFCGRVVFAQPVFVRKVLARFCLKILPRFNGRGFVNFSSINFISS